MPVEGLGGNIGENCRYFSGVPLKRDCPLLSIGNNVTVSGDVSFLLHDNAVIKSGTGYTDLIGKITIGNNCFIGHGSIIMPGVTLKDNTIVAAGSVVTKSTLHSGTVIAGNPAKKIGTTQDYFEKNKEKMLCLNGLTNADINKIIIEQPDKLIVKKGI